MASSGTSVSITYDAFGNRVGKSVNGVVTRYLVEDDVNPTGLPQVFDELTGSTVTRTYTYGLQRISEEQVVSNQWTPSFYGYDGGGNVRNLTNSVGAITDTYEYDAFGNKWTVSGTTPNNYLYRSEQFDPDLGLYYLSARYYNPNIGRFISEDPAGYAGCPILNAFFAFRVGLFAHSHRRDRVPHISFLRCGSPSSLAPQCLSPSFFPVNPSQFTFFPNPLIP